MTGQKALAETRDHSHIQLTEAQAHPRLPARLFNFAVFITTLLASVAIVVFVALATPFVVLLSLIADLVDADGRTAGAWTSAKVSESAQ